MEKYVLKINMVLMVSVLEDINVDPIVMRPMTNNKYNAKKV